MTLSILPLLFLACGDKDADDTGAVEDPGEHACENVGTGESVTAAAKPADAPELHIGEGFTVSLTSGEVGYVAIHADETAELLLFSSVADVVTGLWQGDTELTLPTGSPNEFCATDIPEHFDLDLEAGEYVLQLGPAAVDSVWLMVSSSEGHGHEHEE